MAGRHRRVLLGLALACAVLAPLPWLIGVDRDAGLPPGPTPDAVTRTLTPEEQAELCRLQDEGAPPEEVRRVLPEGSGTVTFLCDRPGT